MDTQWRKGARVVAILSMILACLLLLYLIGLIIIIIHGDETNGNGSEEKGSDDDILKVYIWIIMGVTSFVSLIEIWTGINLWKATEIGQDPARAYELSLRWRGVSIFILFMGFIGTIKIILADYSISVLLVIEFVIRGVFLWIVCNFMWEMQDATSNPNPIPNPTHVTVK